MTALYPEPDPEHVEALNERGRALLSSGRAQEALECFDHALQLADANVAALTGRGRALLGLGGPIDEAAACIHRALALDPDYVDALYAQGNLFLELGRDAEALASYDRALSRQPCHAPALRNRGIVLVKLGRLEEALGSYDAALAVDPRFTGAHFSRGEVLAKLHRLEEALVSYDAALALDPTLFIARFDRGNLCRTLRRNDEAIECFDEVIATAPNCHEAHASRGSVLSALDRHDEAVMSFDRALAIARAPASHRSTYLYERGNALRALMRMDEALASFDEALSLSPDDVEVNWNDSLCRLLAGDFHHGWQRFESRWKGWMKEAVRGFDKPLWLGKEDPAGKTILLHSEQGVGDTLQFCRYASQVARRGARIVLEVQRPLKGLLGRLEGVDLIVGRGEPLPHFDLHCPLMSLPLAFRTAVRTIPSSVPYVKANPERVGFWNEKLQPRRAPRIGLVWSGDPRYPDDHHRSMAARHLEPLLALDLEWMSLQKELRPDDARWMSTHPIVRYFGNEIVDYDDTAALVALTDVVVSVDTSVAHLAGAMGKPVWIMLPFVPDWRWMLDRNDSPWYPSARLFRQSRRNDWQTVVERVADQLSAHVRGRAEGTLGASFG